MEAAGSESGVPGIDDPGGGNTDGLSTFGDRAISSSQVKPGVPLLSRVAARDARVLRLRLLQRPPPPRSASFVSWLMACLLFFDDRNFFVIVIPFTFGQVDCGCGGKFRLRRGRGLRHWAICSSCAMRHPAACGVWWHWWVDSWVDLEALRSGLLE
jgi:hypothetical protein